MIDESLCMYNLYIIASKVHDYQQSVSALCKLYPRRAAGTMIQLLKTVFGNAVRARFSGTAENVYYTTARCCRWRSTCNGPNLRAN